MDKYILKKTYDSWKKHTDRAKFDTLQWVFEGVKAGDLNGEVYFQNKLFESFEEFYAIHRKILKANEKYNFIHIECFVNTPFAEYRMEIYNKAIFELHFKKHKYELLDYFRKDA